MAGNSLIDLGDISKPITAFIEKISDALGGVAKPWQMRRVAKAQADVDKILATSRLEIDDLDRRALSRLLVEESRNQENIESIARNAVPLLGSASKPQEIDNDWLANFLDRAKLVSDSEMQLLWSKILAGEANEPGRYSKRTVSSIGLLDRSDANLFTKLCSFAWTVPALTPQINPVIFDSYSPMYVSCGINFDSLKHLADIGLITFDGLNSYALDGLPDHFEVRYFKTRVTLAISNASETGLSVGKVLMSKMGGELAPLCEPTEVSEFVDYSMRNWIQQDVVAYSNFEPK